MEEIEIQLNVLKDMSLMVKLINEGVPLSKFYIPGKTDILLETIITKNIVMLNNIIKKGFNIKKGEFLYLHHAVRTQELRYVKTILNQIKNDTAYINKVEPSTKDNALHVATDAGVDFPIIMELSHNQVNWNAQNNYGKTPLHNLLRKYVVLENELVDELIDKKANFQLKDKLGITPLDIIKSFNLEKEWSSEPLNQYLIQKVLK